MNGLIFYVPESIATTPAEGHCFVNRWWTVHPEKGVTFYASRRRSWALEPGDIEEPSPQCNSDEATARWLQKKTYPDHDVKLIPAVFVAHATKEMHRLRAELRKSA